MSHPTTELDDVVHQRARLGILAVLVEADRADFNFLRTTLSLTDGNLSRHLQVLKEAGCVEIRKVFEGTAGTPSRASSKRYARSSTPTHGGGAVRSSAAQPTSASRTRSSAAPPPRSPNNRFAKRRYRAISRLRASAATFNGVTVRNSS